MKRLLGTLTVYETDATDCTSALHSKLAGTSGETEFSIELCPNSAYDKLGLERSEQAQILAHELGHFVAHILKLPEESKDMRRTIRNRLMGVNPNSQPLLPSEVEAWQIAEGILPRAKQSKAYDVSVKSYRKHDRIFAALIKRVKELFGE